MQDALPASKESSCLGQVALGAKEALGLVKMLCASCHSIASWCRQTVWSPTPCISRCKQCMHERDSYKHIPSSGEPSDAPSCKNCSSIQVANAARSSSAIEVVFEWGQVLCQQSARALLSQTKLDVINTDNARECKACEVYVSVTDEAVYEYLRMGCCSYSNYGTAAVAPSCQSTRAHCITRAYCGILVQKERLYNRM